MPPEVKKLVEAWLAKARSDLATARLLIQGPEQHLDTGAYHCQQAAEKAVKAWLTARQTPFPKTHDVGALIGASGNKDPEFAALRDDAAILTPLAAGFRYPGDAFEPAPADAMDALERASKIVALISRKLASDLQCDEPRGLP